MSPAIRHFAFLRRAQAIAPFGPGAIHILKGGMAVVTAGLDYWFREAYSGKMANGEQLASVRIQEPRLQLRLGVSHFRLPPGPECELPERPDLAIPLFRFPTWFLCPRCRIMHQFKLDTAGFVHCQNEACQKEPMRQVSFAAVCDHGHLQEFPWREWVHRELVPSCDCRLHYQAGGSGSLADITIICEICGKKRSLTSVMSGQFDDPADPDPAKRVGWSALSRNLTSTKTKEDGGEIGGGGANQEFPCQGGLVWLGEHTGSSCSRPLRAILINATNVHYARVASALWIPAEGEPEDIANVRIRMGMVRARSYIRTCQSVDISPEETVKKLKKELPVEFGKIDDALILIALKVYLGLESSPQPGNSTTTEGELGIRLPEYAQLSKRQDPTETKSDLVIREADISSLPKWLNTRISKISLVDRLMETRVFSGFTRLIPTAPEGAPGAQSLLWKNMPTQTDDRWLPAVQVFGEGIFIRFHEEPLHEWEIKQEVQKHLAPLKNRYEKVLRRTRRSREEITPRVVMLHTLAHLLIRRLVFDCGYGSASLRERLYISSDPAHPMSGILIYTASGDCEGSMGGLVRMGEPENFLRIFEEVLEDARWCSSDPVCTESGNSGGQGTDGLNIAACHDCSLVPETSCEKFNQFLDRGLVVRSRDTKSLGYFSCDR